MSKLGIKSVDEWENHSAKLDFVSNSDMFGIYAIKQDFLWIGKLDSLIRNRINEASESSSLDLTQEIVVLAKSWLSLVYELIRSLDEIDEYKIKDSRGYDFGHFTKFKRDLAIIRVPMLKYQKKGDKETYDSILVYFYPPVFDVVFESSDGIKYLWQKISNDFFELINSYKRSR